MKKLKVKIPILPKIKSIKPKKRVSSLGLYFTITEKQFLFRKYRHQGLSSIQAKMKIWKATQNLKNLLQKLRKQKKSQEEVNKRFKIEFAKLCKMA